jgi:hypothetical protein
MDPFVDFPRKPAPAGRDDRGRAPRRRCSTTGSRRWYETCIRIAATAASPVGADMNRIGIRPPDTPERSTQATRLPMDALPNSSDTSFQLFLAKLLEQPQLEWTEKQQMELEMARSLSTQMVHFAEGMRGGNADLARCLVLLRYAKVLDFMLTSLAARRDIHPQTLRTLFRLANLKVDDAYPV